MYILRVIAGICFGVTLCTAQVIINITGVVIDSANAGISGAVVKLENAGIYTTTSKDGSFTLTGSTAPLQCLTGRTKASIPFLVQNGVLILNLDDKMPVEIRSYDACGRQIFNKRKLFSTGRHQLQGLLHSSGIQFCRISIGNEVYAFKTSPFGTFSVERKNVLGRTSLLAMQAKTTAKITDVLSVTKDGQIDYCDSINTSDTNEIIIKMVPNAGNVVDIDGNVYQSVRIGNQIWTVQNLRVKRYNDGSAILLDTNRTDWDGDTSDTNGRYCIYNNRTDSAYLYRWGALYNWYAVKTGILAPNGWHIPTNAEWNTLQNCLITKGYNWDGSTDGNKVAKSLASRVDWYRSPLDGDIGKDLYRNNSTGFSALPVGFSNRFYFQGQHELTAWWSTDSSTDSYAWFYCLAFNNINLMNESDYKFFGLSVRLLRD